MWALRTIVAGVAHAEPPDPAEAAARTLAEWHGAALHLVHAREHRGLFGGREGRWPPAEGEEAPARTSWHVEDGHPASTVLRLAEAFAADLVVIGASHPHRMGSPFLGGTAERVLRRARAPVLVVREPLHRPLRLVLLTTDLSPLSGAAHDRALELVEEAFGPADALRTLLVIGPPMISPPLPEEAVFRAAEAEMAAFLYARARREARVEVSIRTGAPAREIVSEAAERECDLLVLGTHGGVLLGSVAESVLRHATCNVLVIPAAGAEAGGEIPTPLPA